MTFVTRAATIAAMTFSIAALIGTSAPGKATELDRTAITAPGPDSINVTTPAIVPPSDPAIEPTPAIAVEEKTVFGSLAQAVAAQNAADASDSLRCLAGAIYFESKGEPLSGQLAVAHVIINRTKSGRFPADVCAVVKQRGQFGFVRRGAIPSIDEGRAAWRTAVAVAKVALTATWDSPAPRALYFNTPNRAPAARLTRVASIGNHIFYR
ncbi:MAG TPA: cell wall hydrolase [Sphingomonas sp.]|jgi:spore germination cell wall hydrolase CwlJ-like protein|nr:cell wall hydrolase [Sphingomonas sp.]